MPRARRAARFVAIMAAGIGAAAAAAFIDACKSVAGPQQPPPSEPAETALVVPATPPAAIDASVIDPDALPEASFDAPDEPEAESPADAGKRPAAEAGPGRARDAGAAPRKGKPQQSNIIYE
jgi:hypothetical protein